MTIEEKDRYHHGNLREQLLETAVLHLREEGIEKLSLRAMARELGVSQTAPYRHFRDKNSLLAALASSGYEQLKNVMEQAIDRSSSDAVGALQACGIAYVNFARANPEKYQLMFGPGIVDRQRFAELTLSSDACFQVLLAAVARAQAEGVYAGEPVQMVANSAWALVHGLATLVIGHLQWLMSEEELEIQIRLSTAMFTGKVR